MIRDSVALSVASLVIIVAGLLHGPTGFGFVMVPVPVLPFLLEPARAVALSQVLGLAVCLLMAGWLRSLLLPALLLGLLSGVRLAPRADVRLSRKVVNSLVLATGLTALITATQVYLGAAR